MEGQSWGIVSLAGYGRRAFSRDFALGPNSSQYFRGTAQAFATDSLALVLAQEGLEQALDLPVVQRGFFYMPFMHSESLTIHEEALRLFDQPGLEKRLKYEKMHMDILQQFGRYPHRNAILGRPSTKEEEEYLKEHSGF